MATRCDVTDCDETALAAWTGPDGEVVKACETCGDHLAAEGWNYVSLVT